jgi:hypothetical protein
MGEGAKLQASPDPVEGRYVAGKAGNYEPISAETLKNAATSDKVEEAYLAVAKRMPVRMRVTIDQRKINKFLVECGNADLMLEVKQVRINPNLADIKTIAGQHTGGGGAAQGGANIGAGNIGRGAQGGDDRQKNSDNPWDVVVEVYGIIYIFNPPSMKRLTARLDAEEIAKFQAAISETAPDATPDPAVTPPATTTDPAEATPPTDEIPADDAPADVPVGDAAPPAEAKASEATTPAPAAG